MIIKVNDEEFDVQKVAFMIQGTMMILSNDEIPKNKTFKNVKKIEVIEYGNFKTKIGVITPNF